MTANQASHQSYDDGACMHRVTSQNLRRQQHCNNELALDSPTSDHGQFPADSTSGTLGCTSSANSLTGIGTPGALSGGPLTAAARRVYHCDVPGCLKAFTAKRSLQRHTRSSHAGTLSIVCPYRDCVYHTRGFRRADYLRKHLGRRHQISPHTDR